MTDWLTEAARRPIGEGVKVGQTCNRKGCTGVIGCRATMYGACSCAGPCGDPCPYCQSVQRYCSECGWAERFMVEG